MSAPSNETRNFGPAETAYIDRKFDIIIVLNLFILMVAAFHIHALLTAGDWDFWTDWKDRRWWLVITPITLITFPAALSAVLWIGFRLPFASTLMVLGLLVGQWIGRLVQFHMWGYYPVNFVWPATLIPCAILLDVALLQTRSYIFTAVFGGMLWALTFYPANWALLAPFHLPVDNQGVLMSIADLQGYEYIRTGTPEYIRIIERGTLRTYGGAVATVSAAFSAFLCILMYWIWWFFGRWLGLNIKWLKGI
jgi:methane/ammonia monooxygenase subunit A